MLRRALPRLKRIYTAISVESHNTRLLLYDERRQAQAIEDQSASALHSGWVRPVALQNSRLFSAATGPVVQVPLAQTGEGIKECELTSWAVAVGEEVEEFQQLCEVASDKAAVEITSRFAGTVERLHHQPGDMVQVGEPLLDIRVAEGTELHGETVVGDGSTQAAAQDPAGSRQSDAAEITAGTQTASSSASPAQLSPDVMAAPAAPAKPLEEPVHSASAPAAGSGSRAMTDADSPTLEPHRVSSSPAVRRLAKELGVDMNRVLGTGPNGRVVREDVQAAAAAGQAGPSEEGGSADGPEDAPDAAFFGSQAPSAEHPGASVTVPLRGYRRAMVRSMTAAGAVPHFHLMDELTLTRLVDLRAALKADPAMAGSKLTFLPFVMKAISVALHEYPGVNASLAEDGGALVQHGDHNLGVAMDTPSGLVVPNVKRVQRRSIPDIAAELARLQALAAAGKLPSEDVSGGTLTVSNIGSIGGHFATPLVYGSESAIVSLGRIQALPRFDVGGQVVSEAVMGVSWGADHRVTDGATLTHFSNAVKALLEEPVRLILHMR